MSATIAHKPDCIFCRVVRKEARGDIVYQDDWVTAFRDIRPQAPIHILLVPNGHVDSMNEVQPEHAEVVSRLFWVAKQLARQEGIADGGYRLVINVGAQGGQTVDHLHVHLLGGRRMTWPPG
jgi:histidine triad (HIT) family protein